jgi:hypothetical protein
MAAIVDDQVIVYRGAANVAAVFTWNHNGGDQCLAKIKVDVDDPKIQKLSTDCSTWSRSLQCKDGRLQNNTVYYNKDTRTWKTDSAANSQGQGHIQAEAIGVVDDGEYCWGSHNFMMGPPCLTSVLLRPYLLVLTPAHMSACDGHIPLPWHPVCTSWAPAD